MMRLFKPVPVLGKDLFKNGPALREFCLPQAASCWGWWCSGTLLPRPASRVHPILHPHCGTVTHQALPETGAVEGAEMQIPIHEVLL
jgi:hypothetical protein